MKWRISGSNSKSGKQVSIVLEADDAVSAISTAGTLNISVVSCVPLVQNQGVSNQRKNLGQLIPRRIFGKYADDPMLAEKLKKIGVAGSIAFVVVICIGMKFTGGEDRDRTAVGNGIVAIGILGLLVFLLVFGIGRMIESEN